MPTKQAAHRIQRITLHGLNDFYIGSGGHGDGAVAQNPLHGRRLHAHREEQRGARVAKIVDAQLGDVCLIAQIVEHAIRVAWFAYRLTVRALGFDGQTDATPASLTLRRR